MKSVSLYPLLLQIREKSSENLKYLLFPRDSRLDTLQLDATENSETNIALTSTTKHCSTAELVTGNTMMP